MNDGDCGFIGQLGAAIANGKAHGYDIPNEEADTDDLMDDPPSPTVECGYLTHRAPRHGNGEHPEDASYPAVVEGLVTHQPPSNGDEVRDGRQAGGGLHWDTGSSRCLASPVT